MARAKKIPEIEAGVPFCDAAAAAITVRAEEVFDHAEGVLDLADIERVHDMRVATRRLRAAMEIFAPCFPKREFKRALRDVKTLADALGERRDPDVAIEKLEQTASGLTAEDRPGIEGLVHELRERQAGANEELRGKLAEIEESELRQRLLGLAEAAREPALL